MKKKLMPKERYPNVGPGKKYETVEDYIKASILNPGEYVVPTFGNAMPTFKGQLNDRAIDAIVRYMKQLDKFDPKTGKPLAGDWNQAMTSIPLPTGRPVRATFEDRPATEGYLTHTRGFLSWAFTLDHKRIGIMYMWSVLGSFLVGGIFALLVRTELLTPGAPITASPATYNQWFTLHGAIMVFLVIIPSIPAALGNFVLPIMFGAKDVAFPRLNLMSYYLWITGAIRTVVSLFMGGFDTGWTLYTPYSTTTPAGGVIPVLTGVFILGFSSIFTGLNFVVTTRIRRR